MKLDDVAFGMGMLALGVITIGFFLMALGVYDIAVCGGTSDCAVYVKWVINILK